jgi:ribosomal RNA-processing protein 36
LQTNIRKELSSLPFEELLALKSKLGTKQYNEAFFGSQQQQRPRLGNKNKKKVFKRDNKNRPRELSARVHVPKVREVLHVKKVVRRDPRFEETCGDLDNQVDRYKVLLFHLTIKSSLHELNCD